MILAKKKIEAFPTKRAHTLESQNRQKQTETYEERSKFTRKHIFRNIVASVIHLVYILGIRSLSGTQGERQIVFIDFKEIENFKGLKGKLQNESTILNRPNWQET